MEKHMSKAKEEFLSLKDALPAMEKELQLLLLPKDEDDKANVVLEVRAGTGRWGSPAGGGRP